MARNKHPEETVEKILAVSAKLFMEKGYEHTTLQDIIDNLGGLTKGAIYHHFKGKEEILLAIADRMGEQTEAWMRTVRDDPGLTGAEKLQKMFRASLENSDQTDLFVLAPNMLKNPKLMSILLESMIGEVLPNYMEPVLREAVADGSIRTDCIQGRTGMARNKHPEETVEKILAVSAKLFMEKGYEHTTLQDIIDNLGGLTKGAIYHHFKGKEEILLAIADRMGEQTEAWMRTVRDDPGLTGAEKLQKMFRASLENSDQTDLFVLAPNMLKNPKLMSILLESMIGEVLPNYMEPVLREAVADGSIRTDYPEELGELLLLLSNVWLNPMIYPATPEKTRRRMELYDQMLRSMGLDLLDQELLNQWERFCRLSQERL